MDSRARSSKELIRYIDASFPIYNSAIILTISLYCQSLHHSFRSKVICGIEYNEHECEIQDFVIFRQN